MDSSVSLEDQIWFLRVCHHIPFSLYSDAVTGLVWPRGWVELYLCSSMAAALGGGEWSAARSGRTLPPEKTRYPFYRRLGGPQGRSGRGGKSRPHRDSIPDRPARSQSLYRLSYPAHDSRLVAKSICVHRHLMWVTSEIRGQYCDK